MRLRRAAAMRTGRGVRPRGGARARGAGSGRGARGPRRRARRVHGARSGPPACHRRASRSRPRRRRSTSTAPTKRSVARWSWRSSSATSRPRRPPPASSASCSSAACARWFIEQVEQGLHIADRAARGGGRGLGGHHAGAARSRRRSWRRSASSSARCELYEQLGDRRGAMSTIIALAYLNWGADIHFGASSARHIEEIRRLTSRMKAFTNESERAAFEAQMLYGSHVFARAKVIPDMAIAKGREAHRYAKEIGDPNLEFLAAGGTAMVAPRPRRRRRGEGVDRSRRGGRDRASEPAPRAPARDVAGDRGRGRGRRRGDAYAPGARRAAGGGSGQLAARCEALARLAVESSRLGVRRRRRRADGARGAVGGRGVGARRVAARPLPVGRAGRRGPRADRARPRAVPMRRRRSRARPATRCRPRGTRT